MNGLSLAVRHLRAGGLVAFPTETVYGLGARALDADAVSRVFALKGRPSNNPLIVHVSGARMAREYCTAWPDAAERLARAFWPGPLTLVLPRHERVPAIVTAGGPGVALRCPDHPLTLALLFQLGEGFVGPSANRSGYVSPTTDAHVLGEFPGAAVSLHDAEVHAESLTSSPDCVLVLPSHSPARVGIESTVLSLMDPADPLILRQGMITSHELGEVLGTVPRVREAAYASSTDDAETMESPGMLARHYAPRSPTEMMDAAEIAERLAESDKRAEGVRYAVLVRTLAIEVGARHRLIEMPPTAEGFAAALYSALREADAMPITGILVEMPPTANEVEDERERSLWEAVHDRLRRATSA